MWGFWQPSSDQADDLRVLTRQADLVELKLLVPDDGRFGGRARKVYFLDTPELALKRAGIVVRVRERAGRPDDIVVKLRPMHTRAVPGWLRRSPGFHVEVDAMPGRYVCSGALKRQLGKGAVARARKDGKPLTCLLSAAQRRLLAAYAPCPPAELTTFGPVKARKRQVKVRGLALTAERWVYPDGSALLELSTKCPVDEAAAVSQRVSRALRKDGIAPAKVQHTKTELALGAL
ncbi:hypothetical protein AB0J83_00895 [Actinoplanes sp. NPDC049596]|uniref:hypothetical protein n=1 Tax=unclassified Actinoplanes TaxID=2626549 RepID=UPI00343EFCE7